MRVANGKALGSPLARPRFFLPMAVVIAAIALVGFSRTWFFKQWTDAPELPLSVHLHGAASSLWILFFLIQAALIDRRDVNLHRQLGIIGLAIAAIMTLSAFPAGIDIARARGGDANSIWRLALPFVVAPTFFLLVALALWYRKKPEVHKRLMLLATIQGVTPALGRLPLPESLVPLGFVVGLAALFVGVIAYDFLTRRRIHAATAFGIGVVAASVPARLYLGRTEMWEAFATKLIG